MAELIVGERIAPVWLSAVRKLHLAPHRTALNIVLDIASPTLIAGDDLAIMQAVDSKLQTYTAECHSTPWPARCFPIISTSGPVGLNFTIGT